MDTAKKDENGKPSAGNVRVYKKVSPNGKITLYLGRREYVIKNTTAFAIANSNPGQRYRLANGASTSEADNKPTVISGVAVVDPDYARDRQVFVQLEARFRYGKEDESTGLNYEKPLFLMRKQLWPRDEIISDDQSEQSSSSRSKLQDRLLKKLKELNTFPFTFELPANAPVSITLEHATDEPRRELRCGVVYELRTFVSSGSESAAPTPQPNGSVPRIQRHSSVALMLRIVKLVPEIARMQPYADCTKHFLGSAGRMKLEATLDKPVYAHGEQIQLSVLVCNNTNKQLKRIKISVLQRVAVCLHSRSAFKCSLAEIDSDEGFPINANQTGWCKVYRLSLYDRPAPDKLKIRQRRTGLGLEGRLKPTDSTLLASSSSLDGLITSEQLGIMITYEVCVKLRVGFGGDAKIRLPFVLARSRNAAGRDLDALDQPPSNANQPESRNSMSASTDFATSYFTDRPKTTDGSELASVSNRRTDELQSHSSATATPYRLAASGNRRTAAQNTYISHPQSNLATTASTSRAATSENQDADADLIRLDDGVEDDAADDALVDAIFEDFAKMRAKEGSKP